MMLKTSASQPTKRLFVKSAIAAVSIVVVMATICFTVVAVPTTLIDMPTLLLQKQLSEDQALLKWIVVEIRLPRVMLALIVGAGLAVSGWAIQALFNNPLADPGLIGISSGAALGAVLAILLTNAPLLTLPGYAFLGALITTCLVWQLSRHVAHNAGLLLAGVALNIVINSLIGLLIYWASADQIRQLTFWSLGSLVGANWSTLSWLAPLTALLLYGIYHHRQALTVLLLGEAASWQLGFDPRITRRRIILLTTLLVGSLVATCGTISFIGLIVPHIARLLLGPTHRQLILLNALIGGLLLMLADGLARSILFPGELPIGVITSLAGGLFFISLLISRRATV